MQQLRRFVGPALAGLVLAAVSLPAQASGRAIFSGCVLERGDGSITLATSADDTVVIDTTWLKPTSLDTLSADCVTVMSLVVDGRFVAESVEAGDEPNEVNAVTKETTADRENRARQRAEKDDKNGKKN